MAVGPGDQAPGFTLPGIEGGTRRDYSLSDFAGQTVVLAFYPGDNTAVCTKQLCTYNDDLAQFTDLGAQLLGISPQSVDSHEAFAAKQGFAFPLLADADKAIGGAYGIVGLGGSLYKRAVFVVDAAGTISYAHRAVVGLTFRKTAELVAAVEQAKVG
ncbi:MAG: peroxiredoxin [Acidimicrobiales bacterium]|nr:peroxiredoxin [Acidimicrobiales bacterium]